MKFAMCGLHSENLNWITAYDVREQTSACKNTSLACAIHLRHYKNVDVAQKKDRKETEDGHEWRPHLYLYQVVLFLPPWQTAKHLFLGL